MCCPSLSYLSYDSLSGRADLAPEKASVIKEYAAKFNRADRLVLYPINLVCITGWLVTIYQMYQFEDGSVDDQRKNDMLGQLLFIVMFSLIVTVVRGAVFKYLLLHPTLSLLPASAEKTVGIWMLVLSVLFLLAAVVLNMVVAILVVLDMEAPRCWQRCSTSWLVSSALGSTAFTLPATSSCSESRECASPMGKGASSRPQSDLWPYCFSLRQPRL